MNPQPAPVIATATTVRDALARVEAVAPTAKAQGDPVERAAVIALLGRLRGTIEQAQAEVGPNVIAVPDPDSPDARQASLLLSLLAEGEGGTVSAKPLVQGGREAKFDTKDWWGWALVAVEKLKNLKRHPLIRPAVHVDTLPSNTRISVLGDWGTNLYGAPVCAQSIARDPKPHGMILHLGDVYYSGTVKETQERFLEAWPKRSDAGLMNRAINSNHEMYAGGYGYFRDTLGAFGQKGSYFACTTGEWLIVGLDTAYVDHDIDAEQRAWLDGVLALPAAKKAKVLLFSHHQLFSRFEGQGWSLAADDRLGSVLRSGRVRAWYWGHEHHGSIYDAHPAFSHLLARCVGHSGMPETRTSVSKWPVKETKETAGDPMMWRRFDATEENKGGATLQIPGGVVLDGRNRYIVGEEEKFGPHGYAALDFNGPDLVERICSPEGSVVHEMKIA